MLAILNALLKVSFGAAELVGQVCNLVLQFRILSTLALQFRVLGTLAFQVRVLGLEPLKLAREVRIVGPRFA